MIIMFFDVILKGKYTIYLTKETYMCVCECYVYTRSVYFELCAVSNTILK